MNTSLVKESISTTDNQSQLTDVAIKLGNLIQKKPALNRLLEDVKKDRKSMYRLRHLAKSATLCNEKFGTHLTEFDLMKNSLIHDKETWVSTVMEFTHVHGIELEEKYAKKMFHGGTNTSLPKKYEDETGGRKVISLLFHSGFITSELMPKPLVDMLKAIKDKCFIDKLFFSDRSQIIGTSIVASTLIKNDNMYQLIGAGIGLLLYLAYHEKLKHEAKTFLVKNDIGKQISEVLGK